MKRQGGRSNDKKLLNEGCENKGGASYFAHLFGQFSLHYPPALDRFLDEAFLDDQVWLWHEVKRTAELSLFLR